MILKSVLFLKSAFSVFAVEIFSLSSAGFSLDKTSVRLCSAMMTNSPIPHTMKAVRISPAASK